MLMHENEVLIDFLNIDGMKIIQRNDYFNFSLDSVLLANFITINRTTKSIVDLGTGNGAIPLLLSRRTSAKIKGIEIQEVSADLARRNIELNKLSSRVEIIEEDMKNFHKFIDEQSQDAVVTNPPFFKFNGDPTQLNDLDQLTLARHEISVNLEEIIETASKLLKNRGYFAMVHRPDRLADILEYMKKHRLQPKRVQFCHSKMDKPAKILLIEGLKNASPSMQVLPTLCTHDDKGGYSERVKQMFR